LNPWFLLRAPSSVSFFFRQSCLLGIRILPLRIAALPLRAQRLSVDSG